MQHILVETPKENLLPVVVDSVVYILFEQVITEQCQLATVPDPAVVLY
jgi:hypothetical protein